MNSPIICFGQQPCGFFPKRFLYAKIVAARRLQQEMGGDIVFFYHDSDHDPRETKTLLCERHTGREDALNFQFANRTQKLFSPLYVKRVLPEWQTKVATQLPQYMSRELVDIFKEIAAADVASFCRQMYERMGLLEGVRVECSSDPGFRKRAVSVDDYFVDVTWDGELVRARHRDGKLLLHRGGDSFIELPPTDYDAAQISPARDARLRWMQSVIHCTHYVCGAGERQYLNEADAPEITFVPRDEIADAAHAYIGE
ncbi:MAG: hypothetical protein M3Y69_09625 [Verrucomicrobiota bacterium]|nr:hypothetical protein [Verrucomicrobiota bacterium]